MATFIDKVKRTVGTKKMREEGKAKDSPKAKDAPKPTAREEWTKSAGAELRTGKRPENGGRKVVPPAATKPASTKSAPASTKSAPAIKKSSSSFPVYKKDSDQAKSFRATFHAALKDKLKTFVWEGRTYSTAKKK
ncbi:MAG: hypothetical protein HC883_01445 [Bdellovibrionaceae bacterium]|nr:hypothetical protein [Pseudobdellovibrionaceae bacterium]